MRGEGYRTRLKESLLNYFSLHKTEAVTVREVYLALLPLFSSLSITTVYRNLDRLVEEELLVKGSTEGGKSATYLWGENGGCYKHLHLQCVGCGKILHLDCPDTEKYIGHLAAKHNFRLLCGKTVLYGECADCQEKTAHCVSKSD